MAFDSAPGFRHQGDRCLTVDLGDHIDEITGLRCLTLAQQLRDEAIDGVLDVVASFVSVTIYFEPSSALGKDPCSQLQQRVQILLDAMAAQGNQAFDAIQGRQIVIPVCYGGEHGPDLEYVANTMGLSAEAVIQAHSEAPLRVFLLGFAPGHPYIGIHDERLAIPRRDTPRTAVPAGSVGIANRQSTIYPNRLPGGWHIIGATPLRLFNPDAESPTLLLPGDEVRFEFITSDQFDKIRSGEMEWSV